MLVALETVVTMAMMYFDGDGCGKDDRASLSDLQHNVLWSIRASARGGNAAQNCGAWAAMGARITHRWATIEVVVPAWAAGSARLGSLPLTLQARLTL